MSLASAVFIEIDSGVNGCNKFVFRAGSSRSCGPKSYSKKVQRPAGNSLRSKGRFRISRLSLPGRISYWQPFTVCKDFQGTIFINRSYRVHSASSDRFWQTYIRLSYDAFRSYCENSRSFTLGRIYFLTL